MGFRMLRVFLAAAIGSLVPPVWGQGQPVAAGRPQFEVASLKPNNGCQNVPRSGNLSPSPGRLEMPCVNLQSLLQTAFGTFGDGATVNTTPIHMQGGPSWMQSEFYAVSAKADGPVRTEMLAGPMLQVFLEDRFQLKTHHETREMPVYLMTVAKGGLKVQPLPEGGCTPLDLTHPPAPPKPGEPPPNLCGVMMMGPAQKGGMMIEVRGSNMTQLAQRLSGRVDRTVIDKTGIGGRYNFHLEFTPDQGLRGQAMPMGPGRGGDAGNPPDAAGSAPASDPAPTLFVALQEQLGLKLSPDKGPVDFLIIDHVEKPAAN